MQWFVVFYDILHSIHAGFIDNLSLESIVEAIAWSYVNGGARFVALGGSVGRWVGGQVGRWAGGQVGRWVGGSVGRWVGGSVGRSTLPIILTSTVKNSSHRRGIGIIMSTCDVV